MRRLNKKTLAVCLVLAFLLSLSIFASAEITTKPGVLNWQPTPPPTMPLSNTGKQPAPPPDIPVPRFGVV